MPQAHPDSVNALSEARLRDPASLLGLHHEADGWWLRVWRRDAAQVKVVPQGDAEGPETELTAGAIPGWFEARLETEQPFPYVLRIRHQGSERWIDVLDPWQIPAQIPDFDLGLLRAGRHHHLGEVLGAHASPIGTRFAVWAPEAERVSVIGDWNGFDGRWHPMTPRAAGVWELTIPEAVPGMRYKFELRGAGGVILVKSDPVAWQAEPAPATASVITDPTTFRWTDAAWMEQRQTIDYLHRPLAIYEVHVGSWMRRPAPAQWPTWREIADRLIPYAAGLGFTHIELLPPAQHPFEGSWGYQVTGQYAPNSLHGSPDDLRYFVDRCHAAGLGLIIDFVPGHFPKDDFSLRRFDGSACYEYGDPREGEHRTWGTCVFNFRRPEVRNFLLAAALHWCREYHIDGLRVDAVSSMLYRDYDRDDGAWVANEHGGKANLEAVNFLQELTSTVRTAHRGVLLIAEESTAWKGVTKATAEGGLGFDLKWNMGWMHDTLSYLALNPLLRAGSHDRMTFHQWYAYDDRWVLPLSHDEVVHGKRSLIDKLPGDWWQRRAQLRLLLGYQVAIPGRKLLFQGGEFGMGREFAWDRCVPWAEAAEPDRAGITTFLREALRLYRSEPALFTNDDQRSGFVWVDCENRKESVAAFLRRAPGARDILVALNFTPIIRANYPLRVPAEGTWRELLSSDETRFGGSSAVTGKAFSNPSEGGDGSPAGIRVTLPPFGIAFFAIE